MMSDDEKLEWMETMPVLCAITSRPPTTLGMEFVHDTKWGELYAEIRNTDDGQARVYYTLIRKEPDSEAFGSTRILRKGK